jgi:hypothetical protein
MSQPLGGWRRPAGTARAPESEPSRTPLDRLLLDWRGALERAVAYLTALGLPEDVREPLGR